jgi:glycosyltransferase involved in cell wall biosynthesis
MVKQTDNVPMVSILMLAYNHEKYIAQALDSILMQKVDFTYEIVVGEDCSEDNTRVILLGYKEKYPEIIKLIMNEKNLGMHKNVNSVLRQCRGKYCAICEGDDYWTNPYKLQKQIKFMESHPKYVGSVHKVEIVGENSQPISGFNMNMYCQDTVYTIRHAEKGIMPGQSASLVYRNILTHDSSIIDAMENCNANGDAKLALILALHGDIYCFDEIMSHHRWETTEGTSWSARTKDKNLNLYRFRSYKDLEKLAKGLKNIDMDYHFLYLNFGYGAFVTWLKRPNKENRQILMEIYKQQNDKIKMIFYISKNFFMLPFRKIKKHKELLVKGVGK